MPASVIILFTAAPLVVLLQAITIVFNLYTTTPMIAGGLYFFTAATIMIGLFAAHDERIIPFHKRPPGWRASVAVAIVLSVVALSTAHLMGTAPGTIGTMGNVAACALGAVTGFLIGSRLTAVSL